MEEVSEVILDSFVVTLSQDRIEVRLGKQERDKVVRDGHFASAEPLINELNTNPFDLKTQQKLGLWLYHELPIKPDDPAADSPIFTIQDREVWGRIPWELLYDGSVFLLARIGARFQVFTQNRHPGSTARLLGPIDKLKIAMISTDYGTVQSREDLISRFGESSGFYHIQGADPQGTRKTLRGLQPHILLMDATSSTYLTTGSMPQPMENAKAGKDPSAQSSAWDESPPDWSQATVDYLFSGAAPPLIVAPSNEEFAMDALAGGADTVVLCSRTQVNDEDFYGFTRDFLEMLSPERPLDSSFTEASNAWSDRWGDKLQIPLIYSRFGFQKTEIDDGFDDQDDQAGNIPDGFEADETVDTSQGDTAVQTDQDILIDPAIQSPTAGQAGPAVPADQQTGAIDSKRGNRTGLPAPDLRTATELSSYRSDVAATADRLGVQSDVENLCQVIMAEQWKPPLSIGLFGDWGSGKTSFINLMRKTIDATAERARKGGSAFVKDVIQIDFNAWHYLDANLWANLVVRILEGIRTEVFGTGDDDEESEEYRQLFNRLHVLQEEMDRCNEKQEQLETEVTDLDGQIGEKETEQETTAGKLMTLKTALADSDNAIAGKYAGVKSALSKAVSDLGLSDGITLTQARAEAEKLQQYSARVGAAWKMMSKNKLWWLVLPLAAIMLWVGADPDWAWLSKLPGLKEATATITTLLTAFVTWSQSLAPHMKKLGSGLNAIQTANIEVANLKTGWVQAQEKEIDELETKRRAAIDKVNELKAQKTEKEVEQSQLKDRIEQLERGKGLEEFLMTRAGSADYQQQLGIIALVHKDMRMLQQKLRAGMKTTENGETRTRKYDRVILYVDDLDRCTPARVVEVLQAIHLLLSIPLFVVVVAVDPGWLLQCLLTHYQDLLHKDSEIEVSEWRLTPQNYLEKIFQIPFTLPSMGSLDFPGYVEELFNLSKQPKSEESDKIDLRYHELENTVAFREERVRRFEKQAAPLKKAARKSEPGPQAGQPETAGADTPSEKMEKAAVAEASKEASEKLAQELQQLKQERVELRKVSRQQEKQRSGSEVMPLRFESNPGALKVSSDEKEFVKKLLPLLTTPRMTKRMLNVYRLIRVSLDRDEIDALEKSEHQAVLVLLAVMYSYPSVATEFFTGIRSTDAATMDDYIREIRTKLAGSTKKNHVIWRRLLDAMDEVEAVSDLEIYERWTRVVGRFSFQVGHELAREQN